MALAAFLLSGCAERAPRQPPRVPGPAVPAAGQHAAPAPPAIGGAANEPGEETVKHAVPAIGMVAAATLLLSDSPERDFRQDMRDFVRGISACARAVDPDFLVIPQNGQELLTETGESDGPLQTAYLNAIDGVGREDLFYGYDGDNVPTPPAETDYMAAFLDRAEAAGIQVLVADYCWTPSYVDDAYARGAARGYISFVADHRELDNVPAYPAAPYNENASNVTSLADSANLLYLINPGLFSTRNAFLGALAATNHDLLLIDPYFGSQPLGAGEVTPLKTKQNGGDRLAVAYMSIGEAEDYRPYWQPEWDATPPAWLGEENPDWPGNYKVRYWDPAWQQIIYGKDDSYLRQILDAGFDGVYLDLVDAFEYFER